MEIHCAFDRLVKVSELKPHPKSPRKVSVNGIGIILLESQDAASGHGTEMAFGCLHLSVQPAAQAGWSLVPRRQAIS